MARRLPTSALFAALLLLAGCSSANGGEPAREAPPLGLFSTLPIYWGEGGFSAVLDGTDEKDWVRALLERRFAIEPLDTLEPEAIAGLERLILAQPRPLAPSENVALDDWVREGGHLLVFADPMLTRHSDFAIGDRRRPQDVVLLSPILTRWGLELRFDQDQPGGERWVDVRDGSLPVNLAGAFAPLEGSDCTVSQNGLLAQCLIGEGRVTLLADAAVLDAGHGEGVDERRAASLDSLVGAALDF
jgi:hypothetical protein